MEKIQLENATPEQLSAALHFIKMMAFSRADAEWETQCPARSIYGNFHDTWNDGQDNGEAYMATRVKQVIVDSSKGLKDTLEAILELSEGKPKVEWEVNCPESSLNGNYDDTWNDAQDNGEAYMATRIRQEITEALS